MHDDGLLQGSLKNSMKPVELMVRTWENMLKLSNYFTASRPCFQIQHPIKHNRDVGDAEPIRQWFFLFFFYYISEEEEEAAGVRNPVYALQSRVHPAGSPLAS